MKVKIKSWEAFKYQEVHLVTEMRKGAIYRTKNTKTYVLTGTKFNPNKFVLSAISTSMTASGEDLELELYEGNLK